MKAVDVSLKQTYFEAPYKYGLLKIGVCKLVQLPLLPFHLCAHYNYSYVPVCVIHKPRQAEVVYW